VDPANSWKVRTRRIRHGGTSRGQYHSPLRLRRGQERGPAVSKTTRLSTRPPLRLLTCQNAPQMAGGGGGPKTRRVRLIEEQRKPSRRMEFRRRLRRKPDLAAWSLPLV